jgi:hypothetical protein
MTPGAGEGRWPAVPCPFRQRQVPYSLRKASIGDSREARMAG